MSKPRRTVERAWLAVARPPEVLHGLVRSRLGLPDDFDVEVERELAEQAGQRGDHPAFTYHNDRVVAFDAALANYEAAAKRQWQPEVETRVVSGAPGRARQRAAPASQRAAGPGPAAPEPKYIKGAAVVYGATSLPLNFGVERVEPGAFTESLNRGDDVLATVNHNNDLLLGRRSAGTLRLGDGRHALHVEIDNPATTAGRDVATSIARGDIAGMSFTFVCRKDTWQEKKGVPLRIVQVADLLEVSAVASPAYPDTSVSLRCASLVDYQWYNAMPAAPLSLDMLKLRLDVQALD